MFVVSGISDFPFDGRDVVLAELEVRGAEDRVDLTRMPEPDDGPPRRREVMRARVNLPVPRALR
jgi:hypothetical protein